MRKLEYHPVNFRVLQASAFLPFLILISSVTFGQDANLPGQSWQEHLLRQLTTGNEEQRLDAAAQLGAVFNSAPNTATPQTITVLANSLQRDASPIVRALVARSFENCCSEQVVPNLLGSLGGEREIAVRKAIIYTLAHYRSSQIVPSLIPLLKDKSQEIRAAVAFAMAEIGQADSMMAFVEILQKWQKEEDAFARSQAARGLGIIGDHAAIDVLVRALLRDKSQEVRRKAARSLGFMGTQQDTNVVEALRQATLQADPYLAVIAREALANILLRTPK